MQKKRPRGNGSVQDGTPVGRHKRVRNRLVAGVTVVGIVVIAAGAPTLLHVSARLDDAQRLATLARLDGQAASLAQSLGDERDEVVVYVAAGRRSGAKATVGLRAATDRVDRQVAEIRALPGVPAAVAADLRGLPGLRDTSVKGKGSALDAYRSYSDLITTLHGLTRQLADRAPAGVADEIRADGALERAVDQASATRGLLLAALSVPADAPRIDPVTGLPEAGSDSAGDRTRDALSAAAQQARVREEAALGDFGDEADARTRGSFDSTVTGPDVRSAETFLGRLADAPTLSASDRDTDKDDLDSALSARIDQMRGAQSGLGAAQLLHIDALRDDAVTDLELRAVFVGSCLLVALGVSTAVARTLTRPLSVLRRGAARLAAAPAAEEPVRFTGRNDEFAEVVRSLNTLHGTILAFSGPARGPERPQAPGAPVPGAAPHGQEAPAAPGAPGLTADQRADLQAQVAELRARLRLLKDTVRHTFVNLSLRNLGLVERQLGVIESLEEREQDPERLATLYRLDHLATVMRRHGENLLVLAEHEQNHGHAGPVPLVDVLRAAVSEIERYERITIQTLPPHAQVAGYAADDLSHLVAELLENAASFSPPEAHVELSGWLLESGEVMLSVVDQGIGIADDRLAELNTRLATTDPDTSGGPDTPGGPEEGTGPRSRTRAEGLGLRVTALLAARHGVRVELRRQQQGGGVTAVVILPQPLLPTAPPAASHAPFVPDSAASLSLPGSVAESNSHVLPVRPDAAPASDPLIAAAEEAVRAAHDTAHTAADDTAGDPARTVPAALPGTAAPAALPGEHAGDAPAQDGPPAAGPRVPSARTAMPRRQPQRGRPAGQPGDAQDRAPGTGPYAIGPDTHDRAADTSSGRRGPRTGTGAPGGTEHRVPGPAAEAAPGGDGIDQDTFTMRLPRAPKPGGAALPKRVPKAARATPPPAHRKRSVDPEELRRRLGGFHQGAVEGRRDAEAEIKGQAIPRDAGHADDHGEPERRDPQYPAQHHTEAAGDTVEEAHS